MNTRAVVYGAAAALVSPWHLNGTRLKRLLADAAGPDRHAAVPADAALRSANGTLRLLSRVPASPWRNTCLFRSVAGCLALRWLGMPAQLRIGARRAGEAADLQAHAWIQGFDDEALDESGYRVLSGAGYGRERHID